MSDRKYRQRGYQDVPREPRRDQKPAEKKEYAPRGQPPLAPKTFNMPGFREVVRCARCGNELTVAAVWSLDAACARCGTELHDLFADIFCCRAFTDRGFNTDLIDAPMMLGCGNNDIRHNNVSIIQCV
jgi:hypothetical protein